MSRDPVWTIGAVFAEMDRCTPTRGYHLVGIDGFEPAGECAYVIAHFETRDAAEAALRARALADPEERLVIYAAPDAPESIPVPNRDDGATRRNRPR